MQGWDFQVSPVISGAKDFISYAFSSAKRREKNQPSHKSREQREFFSPCFSLSSANFGIMLLKTTSRNENLFMKKVRSTPFCDPDRVRSSPVPSWGSSGERSRGSRALPEAQPRRCPGAAAAPRRAAQEGSRAPPSSATPGTAPGARSHAGEARTNSPITPQAFEATAQSCGTGLSFEKTSETPNAFPSICFVGSKGEGGKNRLTLL